jgi:hypothetical protein
MEGNSSSTPSPVVLTMRPPRLVTIGRAASPFTYRARSIRLVLAHETRVAGDVGGEDGGKATRSHPSGIPARRMPSYMRSRPAI